MMFLNFDVILCFCVFFVVVVVIYSDDVPFILYSNSIAVFPFLYFCFIALHIRLSEATTDLDADTFSIFARQRIN